MSAEASPLSSPPASSPKEKLKRGKKHKPAQKMENHSDEVSTGYYGELPPVLMDGKEVEIRMIRPGMRATEGAPTYMAVVPPTPGQAKVPVIRIKGEADLPLPPARARIIAMLCRELRPGGPLLLVRVLKFVAADKMFFVWRRRAFYVDMSRAFLESKSGRWLFYELNRFEPYKVISQEGYLKPIAPLNIAAEYHFSEEAEEYLVQKAPSRMLGTLLAGRFMGKEFLFGLILGVVIGALLGYFFGFSAHPTIITIPGNYTAPHT